MIVLQACITGFKTIFKYYEVMWWIKWDFRIRWKKFWVIKNYRKCVPKKWQCPSFHKKTAVKKYTFEIISFSLKYFHAPLMYLGKYKHNYFRIVSKEMRGLNKNLRTGRTIRSILPVLPLWLFFFPITPLLYFYSFFLCLINNGD